jgi:phage baseplate assembly protein W
MMGMDEVTGKAISGEAWLRQAVRRAVKTRKGSRAMVRWYGTNHLLYLDRPITQTAVLELTGDLSESIEKTIPNSKLDTVLDQRNGEELLVAMSIGTERKNLGV